MHMKTAYNNQLYAEFAVLSLANPEAENNILLAEASDRAIETLAMRYFNADTISVFELAELVEDFLEVFTEAPYAGSSYLSQWIEMRLKKKQPVEVY